MLLQKDAIQEVPLESHEDGFYYFYFTVPGKDDGLRPILDLREVNSYIDTKKFRMVALETVLPLITNFTVIDLKDTYFHTNIHSDHYHILCFTPGDKICPFKLPPFDLSITSKVFM